jgi:hypothetical protein
VDRVRRGGYELFEPGGCMPRFGAGRGVWQRCRAVVGVAINIACVALLAVVPYDPDLLLGTAYICLTLRRPRRAYEAIAMVSASGGQIAHRDRTAKQMTKIAAAICARGQRVEAEDVLRKAIALAPQFAAPRQALASLLEEDLRAAGANASPGQWIELEDLLRKSIAESPHIAAPRLALAACLQEKVRYLETQSVSAKVNAPAYRVETENLLREAIAAESHLPAARLALAAFLLERLRYAEAATVAAAAVQVLPIEHRTALSSCTDPVPTPTIRGCRKDDRSFACDRFRTCMGMVRIRQNLAQFLSPPWPRRSGF